jgi:ribosomal protein L19
MISVMIKKEIADKIKPGVTVRVWEIISTGGVGPLGGKGKEDKKGGRISRFEGLVLARKHGNEPGATFTVRGTVADVGVEKIYPIHSPMIQKVEILSVAKKVRRSKLYFIRGLSRKAIRKKLGVSAE